MRITFTLLTLLLLSGCVGDKPKQEQHSMPPPQVGVASPIAATLPIYKQLTGSIEALETVQLNPQVSGLVTAVHVKDGALVKAGDLILEIDQAPYLATIERIKAEIARAEAKVHVSTLQVKRGEQLVAENVIAQQQYDNYVGDLKTAQADLAAAQAALTTANLDLGYTKVTAPIAGRIGKILTTVGNLVQGGGPVPPTYITTIVSLDPTYVTFDLDEATWNKIGGTLLDATKGGDPFPVNVGLLGEDGYPHQGTVRTVDNHIDQGSGSMRIRAVLANPKLTLTPGAFARVQLQLGAPKSVLLVHEKAILSQFNNRIVYVLNEKNETAQKIITVSEQIDNKRVVTDGLSASDRLVVIGQSKIFMPGMVVAPHPASMETGTIIENAQTTEAAPSVKNEGK